MRRCTCPEKAAAAARARCGVAVQSSDRTRFHLGRAVFVLVGAGGVLSRYLKSKITPRPAVDDHKQTREYISASDLNVL